MDDSRTTPDNGRTEQFARLLATCQRRVFLFVLGLVHNPADAEEILQDTNLVLWRKFDDYRTGTDFGGWACQIAYYEVLKFREKRGRQRLLFSDEFTAALAVDWQRTMEQSDPRRRALDGCLNKLSEKDRRLVLARYQPQATTRSVAESLRRSLQGTRRSLHRIRMLLLECIERTLAAEQ